MIEITGLTKRFGEAEVLSDVNMTLEEGKIYGFVGRNGSGQTMLLLGQKEQGKLLVIASHSKEDIEVLCDEIFRFDKGKIIEHVVKEER